MFLGYFGQFRILKNILVIFKDSRGILIILKVLRLFYSFWRFRVHFGDFIGFGGYFDIFNKFRDILVILVVS